MKWYTDMARQRPPREIIAYEGTKFTIEWYYDDNGCSQALDYEQRMKAGTYFAEN